ncbi:MAG: haloacid dehalogenase-like hydrolase [Planctomycetes bacterium]|nr:haloacid dehalogenase-like hydrolase [Planctomycetota bacterium]
MSHAADPLPSWNDTAAKQSIITFVETVTEQDSPGFVPPAERIAVFDNDGTLWPENPVPFQLAYALDTLRRTVEKNPELKQDPMVNAALAGDFAKLLAGKHHDGLLQIVAKTHAGMTTEEFRKGVEDWLAVARHARYKKPYDQLTYLPMQELLAYLRSNGFKTFIVSGGGADFMRAWTERVYGIPPEQVVGSSSRTQYELRSDGPVLIKTMEYLFIDDKEGKPAGIHHNIGRRPIACFGNSDGDKAMMEYTTIDNPHPSFGMIVHHTDAEREYAYDEAPRSSGKLVEALADAPKRGWTVVDMKNDWKKVFCDFSVTAIDILLEPDEVMQARSRIINARLRGVYPAGFPLDAKHRPHITLVQRFVRTADLDKVYQAVEEVFEKTDLSGMNLEAFKIHM